MTQCKAGVPVPGGMVWYCEHEAGHIGSHRTGSSVQWPQTDADKPEAD